MLACLVLHATYLMVLLAALASVARKYLKTTPFIAQNTRQSVDKLGVAFQS